MNVYHIYCDLYMNVYLYIVAYISSEEDAYTFDYARLYIQAYTYLGTRLQKMILGVHMLNFCMQTCTFY